MTEAHNFNRGTQPRLLDPVLGEHPLLLVIAAPTEAKAAVRGVTGITPGEMTISWDPIELSERVSLLLTGVGKSNAAGGTAHALAKHHYGAVISLGIGGALPNPDRTGTIEYQLQIGDRIRCLRSVFADEGVASTGGWQTMAERGFGPRQGMSDPASMSIDGDSRLFDLLETAIPKCASCATVSTCSGTDEAAAQTVRRSGCSVEAMEGAAVGLAVQRVAPHTPFLELRAISNRTGADPGWDLASGLEGLAAIAWVL